MPALNQDNQDLDQTIKSRFDYYQNAFMFNQIRDALLNTKRLPEVNPMIDLSRAASKSSSFSLVKPKDFFQEKFHQFPLLSATRKSCSKKNKKKTQSNSSMKGGKKTRNDTCQYCGKVRGY